MDFITGAIGFILGISVLIAFHEFGHYSVARWVGVKVHRFSVGFGKPILRWVRGADRTEYTLCAIPFGGYVALMGQGTDDITPGEEARAFCNQALWARAAIVAAGPLANFLLAIVLFATVNMLGFYEVKPVIGYVEKPSISAQAGVLPGDEFLSVDGDETPSWRSVSIGLMGGIIERSAVDVELLRDGQIIATRIVADSPDIIDTQTDLLQQIGITPKAQYLAPIIGEVMPGGSAERSGIQAQDRIVSFAGEPVNSWQGLARVITSRPGQAVEVEVERYGERVTLPLTVGSEMEGGQAVGKIGVKAYVPPDFKEQNQFNFVSYGPIDALARGVEETLRMSSMTLSFLWKMLTGGMSWKNINGPITIAEVTGSSFNLGWLVYLMTLALISISIGILNILPIPMLDGGHLLYYLIEFIKGSPVSEQTQMVATRFGIVMIAGLMFLALHNDVMRLIAP